MSGHGALSRRAVLGAGGIGLGALALAACGHGSSDNEARSTPAAQNSPTSQAPSTSTPETSGSGSSTRSSKRKKSRSVTPIIAVQDVPVGGSAKATFQSQPVLVARPTARTAVAHSGICTHMQCPLPAGGKIIECRCHQSQFNTFTGAVVRGPASQPLAAVKVKIEDGQIVPDD
jgi:Rieske Fe-S protein